MQKLAADVAELRGQMAIANNVRSLFRALTRTVFCSQGLTCICLTCVDVLMTVTTLSSPE